MTMPTSLYSEPISKEFGFSHRQFVSLIVWNMAESKLAKRRELRRFTVIWIEEMSRHQLEELFT